jgi:hypothetical protein
LPSRLAFPLQLAFATSYPLSAAFRTGPCYLDVRIPDFAERCSVAMLDNHDDDNHPPNPHRLRKLLACAGLLLVLSSATTLAFASKRIVADQASAATSAASPCVPSTLNRSAVLPGTSLAVSPLPDSYDASPDTQISLLGAPPSALGDVSVRGSRTGRHSGSLKAYSQGDGASFVSSKPFYPGETVSVRGRLTVAGKAQTFAFHFVVSTPDHLRYVAPTHASADAAEVQRFHSRPELEPPALVITATPDLTGRPVLRALLRSRSERADDLRRNRQRRLV